MKNLLLTVVAFCCFLKADAQLLSWTPDFPKEDDAAQVLKITVDATKGNQGLLNHTPLTDVYVHIGVITTSSTSPTNWRYSKFTWGTTPPEANAPADGVNKWAFTINGNLRTYFGITDPNEKILKIAILFRSGTGAKAQRNADGSDMYVPVYPAGLSVRLTQPPTEPKYIPVPEQQAWIVGSNFSITGKASVPSAMKLYHNGILIAS